MGGRSRNRAPSSGKSARLDQFAALPWRLGADGAVEVLLITSRETRRWVIPKGWPMKGLKPHQAAAREAWEEAGVEGRIGSRRIGAFDYDKRLSSGALQPVRVEVYPLKVAVIHDNWPEAAQRARAWVPPSEAADRVDEPGLARILSEFKGSAP